MNRSRPLENHEILLKDLADQFEKSELKSNTGEKVESSHNEPNDIFSCIVCNKIFSKESVWKAHMNSTKHIKRAQANGRSNTVNDSESSFNAQSSIKKQEYIISKLGEGPLNEIIRQTISNIERKQSLTERERELEIQQQEIESLPKEPKIDQEALKENEKEEDDEFIWNPLKLPLGWDGKPIPFWLWKLHGLGVEYPCEICGGKVINGRKNFEKHFMV